MQGKVEHWKSGDVFVIRHDKGYFVTWTPLFYRYTYSVMFKFHHNYYSVVGQVWCTKPGDKSVLQDAVKAEVKATAENYDPSEYDGLTVTADSGWEPVPVEKGVRLDSVDVRVEFKSRRTWRRLKGLRSTWT